MEPTGGQLEGLVAQLMSQLAIAEGRVSTTHGKPEVSGQATPATFKGTKSRASYEVLGQPCTSSEDSLDSCGAFHSSGRGCFSRQTTPGSALTSGFSDSAGDGMNSTSNFTSSDSQDSESSSPLGLGLPMKIDVSANLWQEQSRGERNVMQPQQGEELQNSSLASLQFGLQDAAMMPNSSLPIPNHCPDRALDLHEQIAQPGGSQILAPLLYGVLLQAAAATPENQTAVCAALSTSLAALLTRCLTVKAPARQQEQDMQTMALLQAEAQSQQASTNARIDTDAAQQAVAAAWQQQQASADLLQQSLALQRQVLSKHAGESSPAREHVAPSRDPGFSPAQYFQHSPGHYPLPHQLAGARVPSTQPLPKNSSPFSGSPEPLPSMYSCNQACIPGPGDPLSSQARKSSLASGGAEGGHTGRGLNKGAGYGKHAGRDFAVHAEAVTPGFKGCSVIGEHAHSVAPGAGCDTGLRANLEALQGSDSKCILLVRKINQLGFDSSQLLEAHFSQYGVVDRVLVAHGRAKTVSNQNRFRPATLGFVVMTHAADAQAILADGPEMQIRHAIEGIVEHVVILVKPFERQTEGGEESLSR